jgi:hypothetical protein
MVAIQGGTEMENTMRELTAAELEEVAGGNGNFPSTIEITVGPTSGVTQRIDLSNLSPEQSRVLGVNDHHHLFLTNRGARP